MERVLFVCVHNAGRSVIAEALFNRMAGGRAEAVSAGTAPQEAPHPEVVEAMREIGIDVSRHRGARCLVAAPLPRQAFCRRLLGSCINGARTGQT